MDLIIPQTLGTSTFTRSSKAAYYNSTGLLTFAANDTLRVGYNPANLSVPPLPIIENTATNIYSETEDFGSAVWNRSNATVAPHAAKAPDGTYTAIALIENTANNNHTIDRTIFVSVSPSSVCSVYLKARERTSAYIRTTGSGGTGSTVLFDLITGTYTVITQGTPAIAPSIQNVGNGWYRCTVAQAIGSVNLIVGTYNGAISYTGDGSSGIYVWGSQIEGGLIPTSYIPSVQTFVSTSGTKYYTNSSGLLATVSGAARQEYTPDNLTLPSKLLLEPSATNLLLRSRDFSLSPWVGAVSVSSATSLDPTVSNNTGTVVGDTRNSVLDSLTQSVTTPADTLMRVFSIFIKKTSGATIYPSVVMGTSTYKAGIVFDTNTGNYVTNASTNAPKYVNVKSYPAWWRVSIGTFNNSLTTTSVDIYPAFNSDGSGNSDITATGNQNIWNAQLEVGYVETSPITTTTAAVTSTADSYTSALNNTRSADIYTIGLVYSNILENDFPVWSSATTYGVDVAGSNSVIYNHVKYASLQASNTNHNPATSPTWWSVIGPTNKYAMLDSQVGTQTVGTVGGHIIATIAYANLPSMSFINVVADSITVNIYSGYTLASSQVIDFTGGATGVPITDYTITGLPMSADTYVTLDIYHATLAPAIGNFVVGTKYYLGSTETSPTIGIIDYSVKTIDAFGNPTLTKRGYAKRMNTKSLVDDSQVDLVARILSNARATPCVWNANTNITNLNSNEKTSLIIYGYYKDWEIDCAYSTNSYLTCTVEGLI